MTFLTQLPSILANAPQQADGGGSFLIMMVLMFVMMYFLIIRPQRRQRAAHEAKIAALRSGDKVVTAGGIHGIITNVKASTVVVRVAENVRLEFEKASIATVLQKSEEPKEEETDPAEKAPAADSKT